MRSPSFEVEGFSRSVRTPARGVEAQAHRVLFYAKFHCELNFIERYWCRAKWFSGGNCGYDFEALNATVPEALASVTNAGLALRAIDAYSAGMQYGTEGFKHI